MAKKATEKAKAKGTTKNRKMKSFGIEDMVEAVHNDLQTNEAAPASSKEVTKTAIRAILQSEKALIMGAIGAGDQVAYVGFGTFKSAERAARKGRNPQTGEEMTIAAKKVPTFKPGKGLKDAVK